MPMNKHIFERFYRDAMLNVFFVEKYVLQLPERGEEMEQKTKKHTYLWHLLTMANTDLSIRHDSAAS